VGASRCGARHYVRPIPTTTKSTWPRSVRWIEVHADPTLVWVACERGLSTGWFAYRDPQIARGSACPALAGPVAGVRSSGSGRPRRRVSSTAAASWASIQGRAMVSECLRQAAHATRWRAGSGRAARSSTIPGRRTPGSRAGLLLPDVRGHVRPTYALAPIRSHRTQTRTGWRRARSGRSTSPPCGSFPARRIGSSGNCT